MVLEAIETQSNHLFKQYGKRVEKVEMILERAQAQHRVLKKDVKEFKEKFAKGH